MRTWLAAGLAVATLTKALAGCGDDEASPPATTATTTAASPPCGPDDLLHGVISSFKVEVISDERARATFVLSRDAEVGVLGFRRLLGRRVPRLRLVGRVPFGPQRSAVVRFADDDVAGFEPREDAERFVADLRRRLRTFALELAEERTRLIEFGPQAAERRAARGLSKPETFGFLGFTHICANDRHGRFKLTRITSKKRMRQTLSAVKTELRRRRHLPIPEQGRWLASVLRGHLHYYAVPDNSQALSAFRYRIVLHWRRALRRRSQRSRMPWERMNRLTTRWLPQPRILHPWPDARFAARTRGRSPVR